MLTELMSKYSNTPKAYSPKEVFGWPTGVEAPGNDFSWLTSDLLGLGVTQVGKYGQSQFNRLPWDQKNPPPPGQSALGQPLFDPKPPDFPSKPGQGWKFDSPSESWNNGVGKIGENFSYGWGGNTNLQFGVSDQFNSGTGGNQLDFNLGATIQTTAPDAQWHFGGNYDYNTDTGKSSGGFGASFFIRR